MSKFGICNEDPDFIFSRLLIVCTFLIILLYSIIYIQFSIVIVIISDNYCDWNIFETTSLIGYLHKYITDV